MIALILARGGSKGVPKKNVKFLAGKPLILYPIDAAKKSKNITDVYVSTDDDEISEISRLNGAKVINRPKNISKDKSLDIEAFKHFCLKFKYFEPIAHLRATTPILDSTVIDSAIDLFDENKYTSLRSAHEFSESIFKFYLKGDNYWEPIDKLASDKPRQDTQKIYVPNGYIDIVNPKFFIVNNDFYGDKIYPFITKISPEIDTIEDFNYIEYLINKNAQV